MNDERKPIPNTEAILNNQIDADKVRVEPVNQTILSSIQSYLEMGGTWNPEMMNHNQVRDLLLAIRVYLQSDTPVNYVLQEPVRDEEVKKPWYSELEGFAGSVVEKALRSELTSARKEIERHHLTEIMLRADIQTAKEEYENKCDELTSSKERIAYLEAENVIEKALREENKLLKDILYSEELKFMANNKLYLENKRLREALNKAFYWAQVGNLKASTVDEYERDMEFIRNVIGPNQPESTRGEV